MMGAFQFLAKGSSPTRANEVVNPSRPLSLETPYAMIGL